MIRQNKILSEVVHTHSLQMQILGNGRFKIIICYYIYDNSHLIINSIVSGDVSVQRPHNNHGQDTCREKRSLTQGDRLQHHYINTTRVHAW